MNTRKSAYPLPKSAVRPLSRAERADVTMSAKRQITIPAAMARELNLEPGDKLVARIEDGAIVMRPRPRDWLEYVTSLPSGYYGRTKEEVDAYIREVREGWDERARIAEGDAYVPDDDSDVTAKRTPKNLPLIADGD